MANSSKSRSGPSNWPDNVRPIDMDSLGRLGIDEKHRLYWEGEPLEISKPLSFTRWQIAFGVAGLILTAIGVAAASVSAWADVQTYRASSE